jgi:DNA polymerase
VTPDATGSANERLASLAAKLGAYAAARVRSEPEARVRLDRPLDGPPVVAPKADVSARAGDLLGLGGGFAGGADPKPPYAPTLEGFQEQIASCGRCALAAKRKNLVFGEGASGAPIVFVGPAPGGDEDLTGRPLTGAAGELLERMCAAMGYKRSEMYVCDAVKCRPFGPAPGKESLDACAPYLAHQLGLIRPKVVVALGEAVSTQLLGPGGPFSERRGRWGAYAGLKVMPTYHPSDLLRDPGLKRHVWEDLKQVLKVLA